MYIYWRYWRNALATLKDHKSFSCAHLRIIKISIQRECTYRGHSLTSKSAVQAKGVEKRDLCRWWARLGRACETNGSDYFRVAVLTRAPDSHFVGEARRGEAWVKRKQEGKRRKVNRKARNTSRQPRRGVPLPRAICREKDLFTGLANVILARDPADGTLPQLT